VLDGLEHLPNFEMPGDLLQTIDEQIESLASPLRCLRVSVLMPEHVHLLLSEPTTGILTECHPLSDHFPPKCGPGNKQTAFNL